MPQILIIDRLSCCLVAAHTEKKAENEKRTHTHTHTRTHNSSGSSKQCPKGRGRKRKSEKPQAVAAKRCTSLSKDISTCDGVTL